MTISATSFLSSKLRFGARVLYVEDDWNVATLNEGKLQRAGHTVTHACNFEEVTRFLAEDTFTHVVTDGDLGDGQNRTGNQVAEMAINRGISPDHIAYFSDNPDGANEQLGMVAFDKSFIKGGLQQVLDWLAGNP